MRVSFHCNLFIFEDVPIELNHVFKRYGFAWDRQLRAWVTPFYSKARRHIPNGPISADLACAQIEERESLALSMATEGQTIYHEDFMPFQNAGTEFIVGRYATLLADEPGLGKTAQVIAAADVWQVMKWLIICPASVKINWTREIAKWTRVPKLRSVDIVEGNKFPNSDIVIINYDLLRRHHAKLIEREWDLCSMDEAHYVKEASAGRSLCSVGGYKKETYTMEGGEEHYRLIKHQGIPARRKIAMTGTPIVNRPIEIFNIMRFLCPQAFPDKHSFAKKYCGADLGRFGWDYSGHGTPEQLADLQTLLRSTFMVRRLKKDVLPQLPPKIRRVIELDPETGTRKILKSQAGGFLSFLNKDVLTEEEYRAVIASMPAMAEDFENSATGRQDTGLLKLPMAEKYIAEALEETPKIIVFCYHRAIVEKLMAKFNGIAVCHYGGMSATAKQSSVDRFVNDDKVKLFVGNIVSAGTGVNGLQKAHRMIFIENDWVPGNMTQAEDRAHRMDSVKGLLIDYLVLKGSIDAVMTKTAVYKQTVIERATNDNEKSLIERLLK